MKKVVRLTENDIRRMVMETMNELDWKTYANAAKKRRENGDSAWKLEDYAVKKLNDKYPHNSTIDRFDDKTFGVATQKYTDFMPWLDIDFGKGGIKSNTSFDVWPGEDRPSGPGQISYNAYHDKLFTKDGIEDREGMASHDTHGHDRYFDDNIGTNHYEPTNKNMKKSSSEWDYDKMSKDMGDYFTGKSKYEKGKGWTKDELDEVISRAICKYLK